MYKKTWSPATTYKTGAGRSFTKLPATWKDLPWAELHASCKELQYEAVQTAEATLFDEFERFISETERMREAANPEAGAYEANIRDEYDDPKLSESIKVKIRRIASKDAVEAFCERYSLKKTFLNYLPSIVTFLGDFKLTNMAGEAYDPATARASLEAGNTLGLISGLSYVKQVFNSTEMSGLYNLLMSDSKSAYLEKQYTGPGKTYCALVPVILLGYKQRFGVPYSHWAPEELMYVVSAKLLDAMMYDGSFTREEILLARTEGLKVKTGKDAGTSRNPSYTYKLYGVTEWKDVPEYAQVMFAQIWCAHPANRTKYMILDPKSWDTIPPALIPTDIIVSDVLPNNFVFEKKNNSDFLVSEQSSLHNSGFTA